MFTDPPKEKEPFSWCLVLVWIAGIYGAIPLARFLQEIVSMTIGRDAFLWVVFGFIGALALPAFILTARHAGRATLSRMAWLVAIGLLLGLWAWQLRSNPEEAFHIVEYGGLSLLLYRALLHRYQDLGVYLVAAVLGAMAGTLDEIIQGIVPMRYFDFRDIWLNAGSGILVLAGIALGVRPRLIAQSIGPRSWRTFGLALAVLLTMIGLCAAAILSTNRLPSRESSSTLMRCPGRCLIDASSIAQDQTA